MTDEINFDELDAQLDNVLAHIGTKRHSGRYPWGSGDNGHQRYKEFLILVDGMSKKGMSQTEIAKSLGMSTPELRAQKSNAVNNVKKEEIAQILRLKDSGMSTSAIAREMGINESSVRSKLKPALLERTSKLDDAVAFLKSQVDAQGYIDVGAGVEHYLGLSKDRKDTAISILEQEGYQTFWHKTPTWGDKMTNVKVLAAPDKSFNDLKADPSQIGTIAGHYDKDSNSFKLTKPPVNLNSKRIGIRYDEDGGSDKDGVIEIRRGVDDVSLGGKQYAQVRIAVDGSHYLKGMAMYSDKMPPGIDVIFNTNKKDTGNKLDAMKPLRRDDENPEYIDKNMPFGSMVMQRTYIDKSGKQKQSVLNMVGSGDSLNEEGQWNTWSKNFSSQFLSKQSSTLAKTQLDLTYKIKKDELEIIKDLNNPAVKKKLLQEFADGADSSAKHLKAAGLPRTRAQVILPINSLKDGEVYAPNFKNGEKVVLVRHPHGGIFEIPELTVNNKNREALSVLKQAKDAIGINSKVAARLSGADFDGDTVLVIPNNDKKIKTSPPLAGLKDFNPQADYKLPRGPNGEKTNGLTDKGKQRQMGDISNLITDMTIKHATQAEIARAVRHSMVVIDAEKHNLDYKRSAKENQILQLKKKYQYDPETGTSGAATIISRAKSREPVLDRKPRSQKDGGPINPKTGEKMWEYSGETYTKIEVNPKTGSVKETVKYKPGPTSSKMAETNDARSLVSSNGGKPIEHVYADHANRLKALANEARKEAYVIKPVERNPLAVKTYASEVTSLKAKLMIAQKNAPLERKARIAATAIVTAKKQSNPNLTKDEVKKLNSLALTETRLRMGAKKTPVTFTEREWEAVQKNAISTNVLNALLANAKTDHVKQLATPRERTVMTDAKTARAKAMLASGYTQADIATALGVPLSTLHDAIS